MGTFAGNFDDSFVFSKCVDLPVGRCGSLRYVPSFGILRANTVVAISLHHQELMLLDRVGLLIRVSLPSWPFYVSYLSKSAGIWLSAISRPMGVT
jgi:hypothetical protein